jgi:hypothetical protein
MVKRRPTCADASAAGARSGPQSLRRTGRLLPRDAEGIEVIFGQGLLDALGAWKAERESAAADRDDARVAACRKKRTSEIRRALALVLPGLTAGQRVAIDDLLRSYGLPPLDGDE